MAIEVNLLQKKERKNRSFFLLGFLLLLLTLAVIAGGVFLAWQQNDEIEAVKIQIEQQQQTNQILQADIDGTVEQKEIQQHEALIEQVADLFPEVSITLHEVTSRMPRSAVMDQVIYEENQLNIMVLVSSSEQAIHYLNQLREIEGMEDIRIHSIQAIPEDNAQIASYTIFVEAGDPS